MHKIKYKEYVKKAIEKERGEDQVPVKYRRKAEDDKVVNVVLAAWGDFFSDQINLSKEKICP